MKEFEHDDPMELMCGRVPGEIDVLARCMVEEFAQIGYGADDLFGMFSEPGYPLLNGILRMRGESAIRGLIQEVLDECGTIRVSAVMAPVSCEGDD